MPGTIVFKPLEANIVSKDKDLLGKMDPYLSFHLGGLKRVKTEVAKSGGQHPIWNDAVTVEVSDQTSLTVDLKDKDMLIDDKIGSFEVDLREVQSQGRVRKWYPIFRKNEPAGELLMEATFSGGQYGLNQGQYGTTQGLNQGQYGTSQGLNQGQYGTSQGVVLGQHGTSGLSQGQYGTSQGLSQGQYGTTQGLSQGQYGTTQGLNQGQYGTTQGLNQGQYGTTQGLSHGQYGTSQGLNQGQYGTTQGLSHGTSQGLSQGQYQGTTGHIGGTSHQGGHVITTPGTIISQTSQSYPVQSTTHTHTSHSGQYSGLQQGQYSGLQQGQYGGTSSQYGPNQLGGSGLQTTPLIGGGLPTTQLGGTPTQYSNIPQNQFSGVSGQQGGFPQTQSYGAPSSEQFAKEAILRGSDPLNTQQNYYHNAGLGGYGGNPQGQNLTQTPSFSGTDPLLYEGDKNRFSNPPQQIPYAGKNVETYGHKHGATTGTGAGNVNPNLNPNMNPSNRNY